MSGADSSLADGVRALEEGRGFVDRSRFRSIAVRGAGAAGWLGDLVTAGVRDLGTGEARRSLLLRPTGHVRADFHVIRLADSFLLIQDPGQPEAVDAILSAYVLSSGVELEDETSRREIFCMPGRDEAPGGLWCSRPSMLGPGADAVVVAGTPPAREELLAAGLVEVGEKAVEAWRIGRGEARFVADFGTDAVPAEARLESLVDFSKGCFLGQESAAKVRNLGHPPRAILPFGAAGRVVPGDPVLAEGEVVGEVTSAAPAPGGTALLARVRWEARESALSTGSGVALRPA